MTEIKPESLTITKSFKEYYADPAFRAKHLAYIQERVECPICEQKFARCYMSSHKKSKKHQKLEATKNKMKELDNAQVKEAVALAMKELQEVDLLVRVKEYLNKK